MSLRLNFGLIGYRLTSIFALIICSCSTGTYAKPASVCPTRSANVQQIDIFDGDPEDNVYLAPDDPYKAPNQYTVGDIYSQGRMLVVRCHYADSAVHDIKLYSPLKICDYKEDKRKHSAALVCK